MVRRAVAAALGCLAFLTAAAPAPASHPPRGAAWSDAYLDSGDGTRLHADVFRPAGLTDSERTPAMLVVSPYLGTPSAADPGQPKILEWYRGLYDEAIARGYSVVQVSLRGTGASEGCTDFGGPGDQADVAGAIRWAATRPWSTGRVGMVGHSYDGFAAVAGLAQRPDALAAAVLAAPAIDLYRGVYMNGVRYLQSPAVATYYQSFALIPPLGDLTQAVAATGGRDPSCAREVATESQNGDAGTAFWRERSLATRAAGPRTPVLWAHGFLDGRDDYSAVRPDNFLDVWSRLEGPRRAWFGQFPHVVPGEDNTWNEPEPVGRAGFSGEALDWLDAYVKDDASARARVDRAPAVAVQEGSAGGWRAEPHWPPRAVHHAQLALLPGSYQDGPGNKAEQGDDEGGSCASGIRARCNPLSRTGQGTWTFSKPLAEDVQMAGTATLRARMTAPPGARVIAIAYDVGPENRATLLTRGAALIGADGEVAFSLYPQDWRLRAGHRVGVLLAGSDDFYFAPGETGATVSVTAGTLSLPLAAVPGAALTGEPSRAVRERTSFPVDPGRVADREATLSMPAASRGRLVLRVRPRRVRARRTVVLRIVTSDRAGRRVPRARVRVGRRLIRTDARGAARVRVRFFRTGPRLLRAHAPRYVRTSARIRVLPARRLR